MASHSRTMITRRNFMRAGSVGAAAVGAWATAVPSRTGFAAHPTGVPPRQDLRRLILFPGLNGAQDEHFWPNNRSMSTITEPIADYFDRTTFVRGLGIEGSQNHYAVRSMFTGAPIGDYLDKDPKVASVDQLVAANFAGSTALPSVHLAARPAEHIDFFQAFGRATFFFDPSPVHYDANPVTAYDRLFGGRGSSRRRTDERWRERLLGLHDRQLTRLKSEVVGLDSEREKLEEHARAWSPGPGGDVDPPQGCDAAEPESVRALRAQLQGDEARAYDQELYSPIIDAQIDILARAVVCGMTRVATLQCNSADGNALVPVPGMGSLEHHNTSHGNQVQFAAIQRWYMEKFRRLLDLLDVPDPLDPSGSSTVLDNSCVLWLSECLPVDHGSASVPCFYVGGAAGELVTGTRLQLEGATNRQLLKALARAMGVDDGQTGHFGNVVLSEVLA